MKKTRLNSLAFVLFAAILVSSCGGLNKMVKLAPQVRYSVTPEILEMHADSVEITLKASFPAKFFNKNATLTITPILKYANGQKEFASVTRQGEAVQANNPVISFVSGGSLTHVAKIPYTEDMRISELELKITAQMKDQSVDLPAVKVADGVISTAGLVQDDAKSIMAADKFVRVISQSKGADIHFIINKANLRNSELKAEDVALLKEFITEASEKDNFEFVGIEISAYASPDGPEKLNTKLSEKRAVVAEKYLNKEFKKLNVEGTAEENFFTSKSTPEDWDGFKKLMEASDIQDKELILRVLQMYSDPVVREKEIKNIAATYEEIADGIMPKLRRSQLKVNVNVVGYSDSLLSVYAKENPDTLNLEELMYAATLNDNSDDKLAIYTKAADKYQDDWRASNNMGVIYLNNKDYANAEKALTEANKRQASNAIIQNNLGVVAFMNKDYTKAQEYYNAAAGAGREVSYNQGVIAIKVANYDGAANLFGSDCAFNVALVKLLNNNNTDAALGKIKCSDNPEEAMMYYIKAIVGARTQNSDLLFNNLRTAIDKDPTIAGLAKTDLEFAKYFEDGTFKSIVE